MSLSSSLLFASEDNTIPQEQRFEIPLAERMRPLTLEEYAGQRHLLGEGKPLLLQLKSGFVPSCVLFGPPGIGKTSLVRLMARTTERKLLEINAVSAKVSHLRELVDSAIHSKRISGGKTAIAFVDEIYHFNSQQQNVLLPYVEKGDLILIGTTTENPWFEINKTLLSRMIVFNLNPFSTEELTPVLKRAIYNKERGLGKLEVHPCTGSLERIAALSGGDVRQALNRLETAVLSVSLKGGNQLTPEDVDAATGSATQRYDRTGDDHYALISALIKSVRGSDPDAALYWLARMITSGDDIRFLTRRLCILASEDIGLADSTALILAESAAAACDRVGLPEAQIILGHLVIYLSAAPKSNSAYMAIRSAVDAVKSGDIMEVPAHLKNIRDSGYLYPHDSKDHWVAQAYLPQSRHFFHPEETGAETRLKERLKKYWKRYHSI